MNTLVQLKLMYVFGDYGKDLDFLREHGAIFMLDL